MFIVPVSRRAAVRARHFDRLFDDAFGHIFAQPAADAAPVRRPAIDNLVARSALNFPDHRELLRHIPPRPTERTLQLYQW